MKNKFEALTAFQSWPEDWQRLCAEYWAENDKPSGIVTTSLHPLWAELHNQHVEPDAVARIAEGVKPRKRKKVSSARRWHAQELEWLVFCTDQAKPKAQGIRDFLRRYTDREFEACVQQLRELKNGKKTIYK